LSGREIRALVFEPGKFAEVFGALAAQLHGNPGRWDVISHQIIPGSKKTYGDALDILLEA
jgi:hypothetical protein